MPATLQRLQLKALTAAVGLTRALPNERPSYPQLRMSVTAVADLAPHVRRITFAAPELVGFELTGPDEYFGLLLPAPGGELSMPAADQVNVHAAIQRLPEDRRPTLRWYTVRAARPETGEIDVDMVLHGDAGPASAWATRAVPGLEVGMRVGASGYRPTLADGGRLLVADETALPALAAILAGSDDDLMARTRTFVEVPDPGFAAMLDPDAAHLADAITWLHRGDAAPGSHVLEAVRAADLPALDYAWTCGEHTIATEVRRHLVKERGLDRRRVMFSGYWRVGQARG